MVKRCFLIGHRETPERLCPLLRQAVEEHIVRHGVTEFIVGRYGNFDQLAKRAVTEAKKCHPEITLTLLLYHPAEQRRAIPPEFDGTYYPDGMERVPRRFAIVRANRYALDRSEYLIAYAAHPAGNAWEMVLYARRREKKGMIRVSNLAEQPER